jgi:hypothetical protein
MSMTDAPALHTAPGDLLGLTIPADGHALLAGGEAFLTTAFHATGALAADNRVLRITRFENCPGGSTGRKLLLSVEYEQDDPELHTELFVKFSRDFTDELRDRARVQMESEVRFGLLSRLPNFPIAVPKCYYADYHCESGTGILITQRIAYGTAGIEPHYEKCMDHLLPEPLQHYRALIKALARLAGAHKSGQLADDISRHFPFDPDKLTVSKKAPYTAEQLQVRVDRLAEFASQFPQLLPAEIANPDFIKQLRSEVARFPPHEIAIKRYLQSAPELIALCHWNANVDNAWFWRNAQGELECGLLDWGNASQMNVAMALWGCLAAARTDIWDRHLDELLALFVAELAAHGGPQLDIEELHLHLHLYVAQMGLAWMLDAPHLIRAQLPDLARVTGPLDPYLLASERARNQLQIMTNFLSLWLKYDYSAVLDEFLRRTQAHVA